MPSGTVHIYYRCDYSSHRFSFPHLIKSSKTSKHLVLMTSRALWLHRTSCGDTHHICTFPRAGASATNQSRELDVHSYAQQLGSHRNPLDHILHKNYFAWRYFKLASLGVNRDGFNCTEKDLTNRYLLCLFDYLIFAHSCNVVIFVFELRWLNIHIFSYKHNSLHVKD